ncbi:ABC-type sugar transport system, substrate-binding protein, contains N-terminal xre family HTH domain [Sporobacter termitidis DSM 10068]|uniref:ABC-type sugar transport system, substrate-binding protein, contains N-terminal xre family HTH domain n=1 Tax=Sporobacter termitidis DSM 10068 TaxID=1123282 RepID=A0A1M5XWY7_9FIRM|nr:substrate-binding domain-containing protein [Sporobacter termitidis]SHI03753.1 ABC-type sugar transport system, substrate-binding protein, contains N-terminal xre family HTH domain [Sporobacter termitidis DSM 10068]
MKKALSAVLAFLLVLTLFACGTQTATSPGADSSALTPGSSATPAAGASVSATPSANGDVSASANSVGYFDDGVDPASRRTYNIVWAYPRQNTTMQNIADRLKELETKFNYKVTTYCANNDMDAYLQNIQIFIDQKVDGFLMIFDPATRMRFKEVLDESKIPVVGVLNSVRDDSGSEIVPVAGIDGKTAGDAVLQWLYDNYKTYWGDIDASQIGLLNFNYSVNQDFQDRFDGAKEQFERLLPGNASKIFEVDAVTGNIDEQTGYDLATATLTAHSEIKYWFITSCQEQFASGAARAVEALNLNKNALIIDVGSDQLAKEWDNGYTGAWVAAMAIDDYQYVIPPLCGLIAIMDGKATADTLWSTKRAPGDKVTFYAIPPQMVTKDTYKAFFEQVKKDAGIA